MGITLTSRDILQRFYGRSEAFDNLGLLRSFRLAPNFGIQTCKSFKSHNSLQTSHAPTRNESFCRGLAPRVRWRTNTARVAAIGQIAPAVGASPRDTFRPRSKGMTLSDAWSFPKRRRQANLRARGL
jgi:hypothetical protein